MGNHPSTNDNDGRLTRNSARTSKAVQNTERLSLTPATFAIDYLAGSLASKSAEEDAVQGITCKIFSTTLFPRYIDLGLRLFTYLHSSSGSDAVGIISVTEFKTGVDKILCTVADDEIISLYMKVYAIGKQEMDRGDLMDLLKTACDIAIDHQTKKRQIREDIHEPALSIYNAIFRGKDTIPITSVGGWIAQNCPNLLPGVHKYVVHILATAHRTQVSMADSELTASVLEEKNESTEDEPALSPYLVYFLSTTLSPVFTGQQPSNDTSLVLTAHQILLKMMAALVPSHWLLLYDSNSHGLGSNRFLTHVLNYKSPTLTFFYCQDNYTFLLATATEWRESQNFWGGADCFVLQLKPEYQVVEKGEKLMYLNFAIRGYPMGIRGGANPRSPSLIVDADLTTVTFKKIPYKLDSIEVWGCGKLEERQAQLDVKKWQVKEAEKQRVVKISADDWLDHPDRYLLEMNGRANYVEKPGPDPNPK